MIILRSRDQDGRLSFEVDILALAYGTALKGLHCSPEREADSPPMSGLLDARVLIRLIS